MNPIISWLQKKTEVERAAMVCGMVLAVTVIHTLISRVLIKRIPMMLWGTFDGVFFGVCLLWWGFFTALYLAVKVGTEGAHIGKKSAVYAGLFGLSVTLIKMLLDTLLYPFSGWLWSAVYLYALEDFLIGIAVTLFLFRAVGRRRLKGKRALLMPSVITLGAAALQSIVVACYWYWWKTVFMPEQMTMVWPYIGMVEDAAGLKWATSLIFSAFYVLFWWQLWKGTVFSKSEYSTDV